jgi:hypothetical protein
VFSNAGVFVESITNTAMLGITAGLESAVAIAKQNNGDLNTFRRTLDRLTSPIVRQIRQNALARFTQLQRPFANLVDGVFNRLLPQFDLSNPWSTATRMSNQWNSFLREQPAVAWGAYQAGGATRSDQWYSTTSSAMNVTFWMQPFVISDRFVVSDDTGRVYVDANFSTSDNDSSIPIQQQNPRFVNFTKPAGVTRLRVQVFPNTNQDTGWWYRGVMQGQLWF